MNKLIKVLYDCFYTPPEFPAQNQEVEECYQTFIEVLEKPERRLVLQIIDAKDRIVEDTAIDNSNYKDAHPLGSKRTPHRPFVK